MSRTGMAAERRSRITGGIVSQTGIDEATIDRLVRQFYANVRRDPVLGPIFCDRITDWEPHLQRMCAFWSSVVLMSGRYHGNPMVKHLPLPIDAVHFDRWLALFEETSRKVCTPAAAAHFNERARRIAGKSRTRHCRPTRCSAPQGRTFPQCRARASRSWRGGMTAGAKGSPGGLRTVGAMASGRDIPGLWQL